jgi:hypothetical protein
MKSLTVLIAISSVMTPTSAFMPVTSTSKRSHVSLGSTAAPPERSAPGASYVPAWENRPGLSPEEFMKSDMSKPELIDIWECPLTRWDTEKCVFTY